MVEVSVKAWLLACAVAGVACVFSLAAGAQIPGPGAAHGAGPYANGFASMVPPGQAIASTRAAGLQPLSRPALRGAFYYLRAINRRNVEVRVTVDARSGRIVSATKLASDSPGAGAAPPPPPRYEPYVRGSAHSEEAPLPPGDDLPVESRPIPDRAPAAAAPVPSRPADSTAEVTGSVPAMPAAMPAAAAAKPAEPVASAVNSLPPTPQMVPIAPLE
jgi:hypothetical protein